jgi:hypothetical protein
MDVIMAMTEQREELGWMIDCALNECIHTYSLEHSGNGTVLPFHQDRADIIHIKDNWHINGHRVRLVKRTITYSDWEDYG